MLISRFCEMWESIAYLGKDFKEQCQLLAVFKNSYRNEITVLF